MTIDTSRQSDGNGMPTDKDIVEAYVRYHLEGAEADAWAGIELSQIAIDLPERAWALVRAINSVPVQGEAWQASIRSALGCGVIEDLIVLHESEMLPAILAAAKTDPVLRWELGVIYEASVSPTAWKAISECVGKDPRGAST